MSKSEKPADQETMRLNRFLARTGHGSRRSTGMFGLEIPNTNEPDEDSEITSEASSKAIATSAPSVDLLTASTGSLELVTAVPTGVAEHAAPTGVAEHTEPHNGFAEGQTGGHVEVLPIC